jgi:hypothetical protein
MWPSHCAAAWLLAWCTGACSVELCCFCIACFEEDLTRLHMCVPPAHLL